MILYHYTSKAAYRNIMATGKIVASNPWTTMDSAYGSGWYFTDLEPTNCDAWTVAHCWRRLDVFDRVESYLKFEIPESVTRKCRDHVYMVNQWGNSIKYLDGGDTPRCSKGSCFMCDTIKKVKDFFKL